VNAPAHRPASERLIDALESHRDHYFRRIRTRRIKGDDGALAFINEVGFCTGFTAGMGLPCMREAIVGSREPALPEHIQHDYAIGMTWRLKDSLAAQRLVYYGKAIAGRPGFIARDMIGSFLKLRLASDSYRKLYEKGLLSHCAKLVMDALEKRGPCETRALKLSSGYAQPKRRATFDRAMKELQEKFLALKVEERSDPFTYVWDSMQHRWPDALAEAKRLTTREAAYRIVRRYFEIAGFGNERTLCRLLSIKPELIEAALRRLAREGIIRQEIVVDGFPGRLCVLASLAP